MNKPSILLCSILLLSATLSYGQRKVFDLQQLLKENKLKTHERNVIPITDGDRKGISLTGLIWLEGEMFSKGTIDVDLRGKDVFQKSFIGIAFHGVDTTTHDLIYFRPFNFRAADPIRKIHAVQYTSEPDFPWPRLREEKNGIYEKGIDPPPSATEWFHARIQVGENEIKVYVNNATNPSLTVNKLNTRKGGLIGLWNYGLPGDFANLTVTKE